MQEKRIIVCMQMDAVENWRADPPNDTSLFYLVRKEAWNELQ